MAVVDNGTKVSLPSGLIPVGYVDPSLTETVGVEYERVVTLSVAKATVENASKLTTFQNILADAVVGLEKQVNDLVSADYENVSNTVEYHWELVSISNNQKASLSSDFYSNAAAQYQCKVKVYIKTS